MTKNNIKGIQRKIPSYTIKGLLESENGIQQDEAVNLLVFETRKLPKMLQNENPFRQDFYDIGLVLEGTLHIGIDFNQYEVNPNTFFFGTPKQVITSKSDVKLGFGVLFKKDFLMRQVPPGWLRSLPIFHRFHSSPLLEIDSLESTNILFYLQSMLFEYHATTPYKYDKLRALLMLLLVEISTFQKERVGTEDKKQDHHLDRFEALIDENYNETRSVKDYAEMMFMTPQSLNRTIKLRTGKTASDLISERVVLEIKRNLLYTDKSGDEIAAYLNFYDNSYFVKYFKKYAGMTPKEYRAVNHGKT